MKRPINDVEDLEVYQLALDLAQMTWGIVDTLPMDKCHDIARQLRRAAVSVPSNISEGYGRRSKADYSRFLSISAASNREIHTQLTLLVRFKLKRKEEVQEALDLSVRVGQMLTKLLQSLRD